MSTTVHQGGAKEVSIGIERGKNFQEDVTLAFADGPRGRQRSPPPIPSSCTAAPRRRSRSRPRTTPGAGRLHRQRRPGTRPRAATPRTSSRSPWPRSSREVHAKGTETPARRQERRQETASPAVRLLETGCPRWPEAIFMDASPWIGTLERTQTSYLLLATLAGIVSAAGVLYRIGVIGWALRGSRPCGRRGDREGLPALGATVRVGFVAGIPGHRLRLSPPGRRGRWSLPGLKVVCGLAPLFMGAIACLAYMFIDLERNEVERGHKAVHNPLKGQLLAMNLERYGKQVAYPPVDRRHRRLDRRVRPPQPGPLRDDRPGLVSGRRRAQGADLRRFPGVRPHEDPRA